VYSFFYRRLEDVGLAEDLTLEVWNKIYQARQAYLPQARFTTYLYRVARNHWIDHIRVHSGKSKQVLSLDQPVGGAADEGGARVGDFLKAPDSAPEARQVNQELADKIRDGLKRLNDGEMNVFQLAVYEALKYADIAEILDIPVGTVKSRMHTSLRKLRIWLDKEGVRP
jgi:RNA polymerase sigma-70 factor (ECF subfamily)